MGFDPEIILARARENPAVAMIAAAAAFALADFIAGVAAAFREERFDARLLAVWVSGHLLGRVMPIAVVALLGYYLSEPLYVVAGAALASYVAETLVSLRKNLGVPTPRSLLGPELEQ